MKHYGKEYDYEYVYDDVTCTKYYMEDGDLYIEKIINEGYLSRYILLTDEDAQNVFYNLKFMAEIEQEGLYEKYDEYLDKRNQERGK